MMNLKISLPPLFPREALIYHLGVLVNAEVLCRRCVARGRCRVPLPPGSGL